jgi:hypothetical protein
LSRPTAIDGGNPQGSGTVNCPEHLASRLLCFGVDMGTVTTILYYYYFCLSSLFSLLNNYHRALNKAFDMTPDFFSKIVLTVTYRRLPIPFRTRMTFVIGKPIEVPKNAKATHEEVTFIFCIFPSPFDWFASQSTRWDV